MPAGGSRSRTFDIIGWTTVAVVGTVALTQVLGWAGTRLIAVVQSLTPYLGMLLVPVALVALRRRSFGLATACAATGLGLLVLAAPLAFPDEQPDALEGSTGLRVASLNLLYLNDRIDEVADDLDELAPDVIVFSEYTAEHQAALRQHRLADEYPYRIDRSGLGAGGITVWSRTSLVVDDHPDSSRYSLDVSADGPDGDVRIVAMHTPSPVENFDNLRSDLDLIAQIGRETTTPTLVIGDLNASYWHPDFRRVLDAGFVDAHTANGRGFSTSWPTDRAFPPFVRLDHALTTDGLVATSVDDFDIPGSDHRGFVVTVAPTAPATP